MSERAGILGELSAVLLGESNPTPVKYALSLLHLMSSRVRLPLVELREETKAEVAIVLGRVCEHYPDYVVGEFSGLGRRRLSVNFAIRRGQ